MVRVGMGFRFRLAVGRPDEHAFTGSPEDAQYLGGTVTCGSEPVRDLCVELGRLPYLQDEILVAENEP